MLSFYFSKALEDYKNHSYSRLHTNGPLTELAHKAMLVMSDSSNPPTVQIEKLRSQEPIVHLSEVTQQSGLSLTLGSDSCAPVPLELRMLS